MGGGHSQNARPNLVHKEWHKNACEHSNQVCIAYVYVLSFFLSLKSSSSITIKLKTKMETDYCFSLSLSLRILSDSSTSRKNEILLKSGPQTKRRLSFEEPDLILCSGRDKESYHRNCSCFCCSHRTAAAG